MGKLDGKIAVITGATEGMAFATARLFVREGACVFITGRRQEKLDEAVAALASDAVTGVRGDAADLADLDRLFDVVREKAGAIDVLYLNAGNGPFIPLADVTEAQFDDIFGLNARGTFFAVQKALPLLRDHASVIMTGSVLSVMALPGSSVYAGSKTTLHAFARVWMRELKDRRIRFNVISPGGIDTAPMRAQAPETLEFYKQRIPNNRFGDVEEIAATALFLASSDGAYVNGVELAVDAGLSAPAF